MMWSHSQDLRAGIKASRSLIVFYYREGHQGPGLRRARASTFVRRAAQVPGRWEIKGATWQSLMLKLYIGYADAGTTGKQANKAQKFVK